MNQRWQVGDYFYWWHTPLLRRLLLRPLGQLFSDNDLEGVYGGGKQFDIMRNPLEQTLSFSPLTSHD
ncbi:hypothetical protein PMIT1303_01187 [Prochlorococcus sp. MIT 1303]|nr:hypothetical protein PMIT1303_01187 [Prochlorococcus sp. MIT 1303]